MNSALMGREALLESACYHSSYEPPARIVHREGDLLLVVQLAEPDIPSLYPPGNPLSPAEGDLSARCLITSMDPRFTPVEGFLSAYLNS